MVTADELRVEAALREFALTVTDPEVLAEIHAKNGSAAPANRATGDKGRRS